MGDFQFLAVLLQVAESANVDTVQWLTLGLGGVNLVTVGGLLMKAGRFVGTIEQFKETTEKVLDNLPCKSGVPCVMHPTWDSKERDK